MGEFFAINVQSLHLFAGVEWWEFGPDCDHACEHRATKVQGWGPTVATYELIECCDCGCRAWKDGRWTQSRQRHNGADAFWWGRIEWHKPA